MMDEDKFWQLIESAHQDSHGGMDLKCEKIKLAISHLSADEANAFYNIFNQMMNKAYSWSIWGAAYVMQGGCSDDSFTDFRASLISRGKNEFDKAVANADELSTEHFDEESWYFEGFQYAVVEGVELVLGAVPDTMPSYPNEPSGTPWEEDPTELKQRYPNLWAAFEDIWTVSHELEPPQTKPWWKFW